MFCSYSIILCFCRTKFWQWNLGIWELMCWTSKRQTDKFGCLHLWGTSNSLHVEWLNIFTPTLLCMGSIVHRSNFKILHRDLMPLSIVLYFWGVGGNVCIFFIKIQSLFSSLSRYTPLSSKSRSKTWELLSIMKFERWSRVWLMNYSQ